MEIFDYCIVLNGRDILDEIELTRYQTDKAYLSFDEYVQMTKERNRDVTKLFEERGIDL